MGVMLSMGGGAKRHLTHEQWRIALHTLRRPLTLCIGPPGSGKTTTAVGVVKTFMSLDLTERVRNEFQVKLQVLVVCPSNNACDDMCTRLRGEGLRAYRILADLLQQRVPHGDPRDIMSLHRAVVNRMRALASSVNLRNRANWEKAVRNQELKVVLFSRYLVALQDRGVILEEEAAKHRGDYYSKAERQVIEHPKSIFVCTPPNGILGKLVKYQFE